MESSELEEKMTGARLHRGYGDKLVEIARRLNVSKTELVRQILENYVNDFSEK